MSLVEIPLFFSSRNSWSNCDHSKTHCLSHSNKASVVGVNSISDLNFSSLTWSCKTRKCELFDLHKDLVPFDEAWSWQKSIVRGKKALLVMNKEFSDSLIVLQHHPVYTLGTGSSNEYLNLDSNTACYSIYRTERGGEVTYHGPGQLVMYPIMNLRNHKMDLHWYLRALEEVVIRMLDVTFSIKASRLKGFTGVWVGNEKVAAVGIKVSNWISYHGLAVNVSTDLAPFEKIVPCGIKNCEVGSIQRLVGSCKSECELIQMAYEGLVREFSQVFQLKILLKSMHTHD